MRLFFLLLMLITGFEYGLSQNHRLLMVVPPDLYHDTEFSDPMLALNKAGVEVIIASTHVGVVHGVNGDSINSSIVLSEVDTREYDAICIMGGKGTGKYLWDNKGVAELIRQFDQEGKLVTGICAGAVSLARAGVLDNKSATTFPVNGFIRQLEESGAHYSADSVKVDGNIITANGPIGAKCFGVEIVKYMNGEKEKMTRLRDDQTELEQ